MGWFNQRHRNSITCFKPIQLYRSWLGWLTIACLCYDETGHRLELNQTEQCVRPSIGPKLDTFRWLNWIQKRAKNLNSSNGEGRGWREGGGKGREGGGGRGEEARALLERFPTQATQLPLARLGCHPITISHSTIKPSALFINYRHWTWIIWDDPLRSRLTWLNWIGLRPLI